MRASASTYWGDNRSQSYRRPSGIVRIHRVQFTQFDDLPDGFITFDDFARQTENQPDVEQLTRARRELRTQRNVSGLAGLRLTAGLSQATLAQLVGTSQPRLSLWEKGEERPQFESLKKLKEALGVTFDKLFEAIDG